MIESSFWETPRGIWSIVVIGCVVGGSLGFWFGYLLGSLPPREIIIRIIQDAAK